MIKNIIYTFGILVTLLFYYLFYEHQNTRFLNLNKKLDLITQKIDSLEKGNVSTKPVSVDYKENNIVKNNVINFSDSLTNLFNQKDKINIVSDSILTKDSISVDEVTTIIDTFCYDLSEQYKILNFYNNKIRIKKNLTPGSILMSINDSLVHNDVTYILKEINGEGSYIQLLNPSNDTSCKFHKVLQTF